MKQVLAALKLVLKDVASLGNDSNKALVGAIAAGVVTVAANVLGITSLTAAEVTAVILAVASVAATVEKLNVLKASAGK